jgi:hypothetical protein
MNRNMLLGVLIGAVIAALTLSSGVGTLARLEAQAPADPPAAKEATQDAHLIKIQNEFALKELHQLRDEMLNYARQRRQKETQLSIVRERLKEIANIPLAPNDVQAVVEKDPAITQLQKEIGEVEEVLKQVAKIVKDGKDSAIYKELKRSRDDLGKAFAKRQEEVRPLAIAEIRNSRQGALESEIATLESGIYFLKLEEESLRVLVDTAIEKTRTMTQQEKEATPPDPKLRSMDKKLDNILNRLEKIEKRLDKLEPKK